MFSAELCPEIGSRFLAEGLIFCKKHGLKSHQVFQFAGACDHSKGLCHFNRRCLGVHGWSSLSLVVIVVGDSNGAVRNELAEGYLVSCPHVIHACYLGVALGSLWGHFGIVLQSFSDHGAVSMDDVGLTSDECGFTLG